MQADLPRPEPLARALALLREASRAIAETRPSGYSDALAADRALGAFSGAAALLEDEPLAEALVAAIEALAERMAAAAHDWALAVGDAGRIAPGPGGVAKDATAIRAFLDALDRLERHRLTSQGDEYRLLALAFRHAGDFPQMDRLTTLAAHGRTATAALAQAGRRLRADILRAP